MTLRQSPLIALAAFVLAAMATPAAAADRIPVKTADELPRHTYKVSGKALDIITDDKAFVPLLEEMVKNMKADLEKYDIQDASTLQGMYDFLGLAASIRGDFDAALEYSEKSKALETKEAEKLMRGVTLGARVAAIRASGGDASKFPALFKQELKARVEPLPYAVIKDQLIAVRGQSKMVTRELIEGTITTTLDPMLEANHGDIPSPMAAALVSTRATLDYGLELLPLMADVYGEIIDAQAANTPDVDVWTPRLVTLDPAMDAKPVVVGIWDSGVDVTQFEGRLWTNAAEKNDGKDDDGNGFVDDLHGITFGPDHRPSTGPLAKVDGLHGDLNQMIDYVAASQDMQAGVQSPEVEAFQSHVRGLKGEAVRVFQEDIGLIGNYLHGTHVAGVAVAGNPFARIVHVTENFPYKHIPDEAPTVEEYRRWGDSARQSVEYLKQSGARVVNMSWRIPRAAVEGMLAAKGAGGSKEERAELSRKIFAELRKGLEEAIAGAPEILFIAGSGNEDNDVDFSEYVPAGLKLPNLLTVGAVDHHDKPANFTSFGKHVELYANGYRIESVVPGGRKIKFSGTSMASPQVANLAVKILAVMPEMKPADVITLIKSNAEPLPDQEGRWVIHPKRTLEALGVGI